MSIRQKLNAGRMLAASGVLATGMLASMAAPAGAGTQDTVAADEAVEAQAIAPPCVRASERSDFWGKYTDVRNLCGRTHRVKVVVAFGFDGPCVELDDGEGYTHSYGHAGRFDSLQLC